MAILELMPFDDGVLPIKYLGVPLISSRLKIRDCKILVEQVKKKVGDWKNKWLSLAGRLQLIQSVLSAMHIYWASVFILPNSVINDIKKVLAGFLWCQGEMCKGKAKFKWKHVCLPKSEGGLGIRKLDEFNMALMVNHVWKILIDKETLWVKWIHAYKLKNQNFWEIKLGNNVNWGWQMIMSIRPIIRDYLWFKLSDGKTTSAWFDKWDPNGPIINHITNRYLCNAGFNSNKHVVDIIHNDGWSWPSEWMNEFPPLTLFAIPNLIPGAEDKLVWRTLDGMHHDKSVALFWETIRVKGDVVSWWQLVWSSYGIPKYNIHLWLVMWKRHKTQDRLKMWDVDPWTYLSSLRCFLYGCQADSHKHLFYECPYALNVFYGILKFAQINLFTATWDNVLSWALPLVCKDKIDGIIARLVVSVSSYLIWQERNARLHGKEKRKEDVLIEMAKQVIRIKLASIRFKKKSRVQEVKKIWRIAWDSTSYSIS